MGLTNYPACKSLIIRETHNPEGKRLKSFPRKKSDNNKQYFLKILLWAYLKQWVKSFAKGIRQS